MPSMLYNNKIEILLSSSSAVSADAAVAGTLYVPKARAIMVLVEGFGSCYRLVVLPQVVHLEVQKGCHRSFVVQDARTSSSRTTLSLNLDNIKDIELPSGSGDEMCPQYKVQRCLCFLLPRSNDGRAAFVPSLQR